MIIVPNHQCGAMDPSAVMADLQWHAHSRAGQTQGATHPARANDKKVKQRANAEPMMMWYHKTSQL
jgi:hypothetical protein